ncbi:MAG: UDP-N-acetylmuramate--L-alanine ligase [Synergistaceae bacterium]|jgi:UDP-N-acetylmuramate--alanine ligase|nr:UDP-N-acetylmuramate--L-alanine ligase [Synergistaceae bacterium]
MFDAETGERPGAPEGFGGIQRVHLMGMGGSGMSGLALLLSGMGFKVSGCDLSQSEYTARLASLGVDCSVGHSPSHIEEFSPQLVIYSGAVSEDHEELAAAREKGVGAMRRGLALSRLFNARLGVGVTGTHGKTTTSSMIGLILEEAGFDPTLAVGAEICDIGANARVGKSDFFVAEIDESDGSFEFFHPSVAAITNVDWDHVNYFHTRDDVLPAFVRFARARKLGAPLVICAEDKGSRSLIQALRDDPNVVTCGWGRSWHWGAFDAERRAGGGAAFSVIRGGKPLGRVELAVSGEHNIMNALVACAAAASLGVSFPGMAKTLRGFRGAKRRLEKVGQKAISGGWVEVIDDYAHHPVEIEASLSALRDVYPGQRLVVVFQPHRYTRTNAFFREIASALEIADALLLLPVYSAGEPEQGPGSAAIVEIVNDSGRDAVLCGDEEDALGKLRVSLRPGDVVVTLGAGSVSHLGPKLLA